MRRCRSEVLCQMPKVVLERPAGMSPSFILQDFGSIYDGLAMALEGYPFVYVNMAEY